MSKEWAILFCVFMLGFSLAMTIVTYNYDLNDKAIEKAKGE